MTINPFELKDYLFDSRERITQQFKDKPVIGKYQELINFEADILQDILKKLMQERSIDTALGAQLDIIGNIVGQPRALFDVSIVYFFGFDTALGAQSYSSLSDPQLGGRYRSLNEATRGVRSLNDEEYRTLIKIKVKKNITRGLIDEFIEIVKLLYNVPSITYTESTASIEIDIGRALNDPDLSYFKGLDEEELGNRYLPLPLGVELTFV